MSDPGQFYDDLADDYHLNYADWDEAVPRQGRVLARLIRGRYGDNGAATLLDCSCGIGTQAIGLALEGFEVTGTDISPKSIDRARREADAFEVAVDFGVADVRDLGNQAPGEFEVVISCDNSLPHLLTDEDLALALANMYAKVAPGGLVVIGMRDYDSLADARPRFTPAQIVEKGDYRSVLFQLWDWSADGHTYTLTMFRHNHADGEWITKIDAVTYRALKRIELDRMMAQAGFTDIEWHFPGTTGHHQPLMTARRPLTESGRS